MVASPNGHENPQDHQFCAQCGAPIASSEVDPRGAPPRTATESGRKAGTQPWYQRTWALTA
jgi:hypothetical protein